MGGLPTMFRALSGLVHALQAAQRAAAAELAALRAAHAAALEGAAAAAESARSALAGAHAQEAAQLREQAKAAAEAASVRGSAIPSLSAADPERAFRWRVTVVLLCIAVGVGVVSSSLRPKIGAPRVPGTRGNASGAGGRQERQRFAGWGTRAHYVCRISPCSPAASEEKDATCMLLDGSPRRHGGCRRAQGTRSALSPTSAASSLRCSSALTPGAAPPERRARRAVRCMHRASSRKPVQARVWFCEGARRCWRSLLVSPWPPHDPACAAPHGSVNQGTFAQPSSLPAYRGCTPATGYRPAWRSVTAGLRAGQRRSQARAGLTLQGPAREPRAEDLARAAAAEADARGARAELAALRARMAQQAAELLLREETFNRTVAGGGGGRAPQGRAAAGAAAPAAAGGAG